MARLVTLSFTLSFGLCFCIQTQVFPIQQQATGYIYRSDNDGPGSLIQLGTHQNILQYKQPHAFAIPIPLNAQPIVQVYGHQPKNPIVFPQDELEIKPIIEPEIVNDNKEIIETNASKADDDDDDDEDSGDESESHEEEPVRYLNVRPHTSSTESEAGENYESENQATKGGSTVEGSKGHQFHEKGESGHYGSENQAKSYDESKGEHKKYHDDADSLKQHEESAGNHNLADWGKKKFYSKGEDVDGYHKVFHRDEYKKDKKFYDVADERGSYEKYGNHHAYHKKGAGEHKKAGKHVAGHQQGEYGDKGHQDKGHHDSSNKGFSSKSGEEEEYFQETEHGKKGGAAEGKTHGYSDGH